LNVSLYPPIIFKKASVEASFSKVKFYDHWAIGAPKEGDQHSNKKL
jgi:hypothetical protein